MPDLPSAPAHAFKKEHVIAELKSTNALRAIDELIDHLASSGVVPADARDSIASAVKERERSMSTGIGSGVAVPHAAAQRVDEIVMAFGRSTQGIEFNAVDQQPVKFVMLVIVPANQRERHLPTLARISRLFHRKETREALGAAKDAEAIAAALTATSIVPSTAPAT